VGAARPEEVTLDEPSAASSEPPPSGRPLRPAIQQEIAGRAAREGYDFGPGRSAWERVHATAAAILADWLPSLPAGLRRYAQARLYRALHDSGPGPYSEADTRAAIQLLDRALRPGSGQKTGPHGATPREGAAP